MSSDMFGGIYIGLVTSAAAFVVWLMFWGLDIFVKAARAELTAVERDRLADEKRQIEKANAEWCRDATSYQGKLNRIRAILAEDDPEEEEE